MKQKGRVTPFTQYLIDGIRVARLEQNISGRKLSLEITGSNPTRIGSIENEYTNDRYSPELLQRAIDYLHMRVEDLFPADILAQDTLQEKTKIPILRNMSIRGALLSLLEEGYFHTPFAFRNYGTLQQFSGSDLNTQRQRLLRSAGADV